MKELIETAKDFAAVTETEKVPGEHKTLWEAAKNFELTEEEKSAEEELREACEEALLHLKKGHPKMTEDILLSVLKKFPGA